MYYYNIQSDIANQIIRDNASISDLNFLEKQIDEFLNSRKRKDMINAYNYLIGNHDILKRKRGIWVSSDKFKENNRLPNNRIVDNQYAKVVEQKN